MGFHPATLENQDELRDWLQKEILPSEHRSLYVIEQIYNRCLKLRIEPPTKGRVKRLVASAIHHHEQDFFMQTAEKLSLEVKMRLHVLIEHAGELDE